jgi:hypothetical protein
MLTRRAKRKMEKPSIKLSVEDANAWTEAEAKADAWAKSMNLQVTDIMATMNEADIKRYTEYKVRYDAALNCYYECVQSKRRILDAAEALVMASSFE